ncbi:hypothetical protein MY04_5063 [Flammeovirga sp. MY04]|uniref:beta-galactosidase n=1 Tax=Flammeovirga sp. MY04 TaxID=1191459 RepID=UPI000806110E|nr:beta-galactosidase [Flammeovirga sp. MY04]ANQ52398.1 hypothetical protein MY04_5063 [Flammeovirga sp. MY04]
MTKKLPLLIFITFLFTGIHAQSFEKNFQKEKKALSTLIQKAKKKGIDVYKEQTTLRTAEICYRFADWDRKNIKKNTELFKKVKTYRDSADQVAIDLPMREEKEILRMLEEAQLSLQKALKGEIKKQKSVAIDWSNLEIKENDILYKNQPVFLADYSWKPSDKFTTEYHGQLDGLFMSTAYITDSKGDLKPKLLSEIENKPSKTAGFVFINHKNPPKWFTKQYPETSIGKRRYFDYDIDHPETKKLLDLLFKNTVPQIQGKKYSQLGYMLVNEPHWHTKKGEWDTGAVSTFTHQKFKEYLKEKHQHIDQLNLVWGSNFTSFDEVTIEVPIDEKLLGTAQWYDWCRFNQIRGNEWFKFLNDEITQYDPTAKTHIKVMPHLFTNNGRTHGIDLEYMTRLTSIIGNDAGATYSDMWNKKAEPWKARYYFDFRQLCMSYDFMKSVSPEKVMFNSECHFISTIRFRDLYLKPEYARATYWLATTLGMNAVQTWFWPRGLDGSLRKEAKGYAASITQMPSVLNEITLTFADLNANGASIAALQKQRKPIRVFQSETSAINVKSYMDDVFATYESVLFDGFPIGFVTKGILEEQNHNQWDVILIRKTPNVTKAERDALQSYIDIGGKIVMDKESILTDEYGRKLSPLKGSSIVFVDDLKELRENALASVAIKKPFDVQEQSELSNQSCIWRYHQVAEDQGIVSIVNVGHSEKEINIKSSKKMVIKNIIDGTSSKANFVMQPLEVRYVQVSLK